MAASAVPTQIDPNVTTGFADTYFLLGTEYGSLASFPAESGSSKSTPPVDKILPGLATSWTKTAQGYDVTLGNGKSQFGNPITSQDVQWSFERSLAASKAGISDLFGASLLTAAGVNPTNPITIIDSKHFTINETATGQSEPLLAVVHPTIIDSTEAKKHATAADPWAKAWLSKNSASFGPYSVQSFTPGENVTFVANPGWWGPKVQFTKITVRAIPSSSSRLQLLQSGQVDMATQLSLTDFVSIQGKSGFTTPTVPSATQINVDFLQKSGPLKDARVRQAISLGIDRSSLVQNAWKGVAAVPTGWYSQFVPLKGAPTTPLETNVAKAKQLLAAAGYGSGLTLSIAPDVSGLSGPDQNDLLVQLQAQLKQIGVTLNLVTGQSAAQNLDGLLAGKYDMFVSLATGFYPSDLSLAQNGLSSTSNLSALFGPWSDPQMDSLITQANGLAPGDAQDALLVQINQLAAQDVFWTPLVDTENYAAFRGTITGFAPTALDIPPFAYLKNG